MSRVIYNITKEAEISGLSGTSATVQQARAEGIKAWINETFPDYFECVYTASSNYHYVDIFFKGTNSGIYISLTTNNTSFSSGYIYMGARTILRSTDLIDSGLELMMIVSKYGFIPAVFHGTPSAVQTMAVNMGDKLIPLILKSSTEMLVPLENTLKNSTNLMHRGLSDKIYLSKVNMPFLSDEPEGIYISSGINIGNGRLYKIGNETFAELENSDYCSVALKTEEPSAEDYANIERRLEG